MHQKRKLRCKWLPYISTAVWTNFLSFCVLYFVRLEEENYKKVKFALKIHRIERIKDAFLKGKMIEKHCIRISPFIPHTHTFAEFQKRFFAQRSVRG